MEGIREQRIYVGIKDGMFERAAMPGDDFKLQTTKERKDGSKYDVVRFSYLEGNIAALYVMPQEINKRVYDFLYVVVKNIGEERIIRTWLDSDCARDILDRIPNLSGDMLLTINVGADPAKDNREFVWINSGADKISKYYNAKNRYDKPDWEPTMINGQKVWDKSKQLDWYKQKVREWDQSLRKTAAI